MVGWMAWIVVARASCVTWEEVREHPERFECREDAVGTNPLDCTACTRRCPDGKDDCVVIASPDGCPLATPMANAPCTDTGLECQYEPYCGPLYHGLARHVCLFLGVATCDYQRVWRVALMSAPGPRDPTCGEVRDAFERTCCGDERTDASPFSLTDAL
jgi:hypothetical protein